MASKLATKMPIADSGIWQGASVIALGPLKPTSGTDSRVFPTKIEDVIDTTTGGTLFTLKTGWTFFTALTEDGVTVDRTYDESNGIAVDQRSTTLRGGVPTNARMQLTGTTIDTSLANLVTLWNLSAAVAIASGASTVAQHSVKLGAPSYIPERFLAVLQQDETTQLLRALVFRRAKLSAPGNMQIHSPDASRNAFTFRCDIDSTITDGSEFGMMFESDAAVV